MTIHITEDHATALRFHAIADARKLGLLSPESIELHKLDWGALQDVKKQARIASNTVLEKILTTNPENGKAITDIELAAEAFLELASAVGFESDARSAAGSRSPRSHGGRCASSERRWRRLWC